MNSYDKPAIFLGWCKQTAGRIWVFRIDRGTPEVDWFNERGIDYITVDPINNPGLPNKGQIFFGKYKKQSPLLYKENDPTEEEVANFSAYLKEITEKYSTKKP